MSWLGSFPTGQGSEQDVNYEYYSSLALVTSVVVYVLAMFAHAAEWASARRVQADESVEARELVSVGSERVGTDARARRPPPASAPTGGPSSSAGSVWR